MVSLNPLTFLLRLRLSTVASTIKVCRDVVNFDREGISELVNASTTHICLIANSGIKAFHFSIIFCNSFVLKLLHCRNSSLSSSEIVSPTGGKKRKEYREKKHEVGYYEHQLEDLQD